MKKRNQKPDEEQSDAKPAKITRSVLLLSLFLYSSGLFATTHFTFTDKCIQAHEQIYALKLQSAQRTLEQVALEDDDNLAVDLLLHLRYMLQAMITEEKGDYKAFLSFHKRAAHKVGISSSKSAYRGFILAEFNLHLALLKAKQENLPSAALALKQAYKQLRRNKEQHPDFLLNNKTLGLMKAYLSTVPDNYKWAAKLLGIQGDLDEGLALLHKVATAKDGSRYGHFPKEARYILAFTKAAVQRDNEGAWEEISKVHDEDRNLLSVFFKASIAFRVHKNEEVLRILSHKPSGTTYLPFPLLEYMTGAAKLFKLDPSSLIHFEAFQEQFKGENYKRANLEKMCWHALLFKTEADYLQLKSLISQTGKTLSEEDKMATRSLEKPTPHVELLKARLLFDGGYYKRSLAVLKQLKACDFKSAERKAEYCYRKASVYRELNQPELAEMFYLACVKYGTLSTEYYPSYACLHLADFAIKQGDKLKAKGLFQKALSFKNNKEYRDSIEHRAKTGLKAL